LLQLLLLLLPCVDGQGHEPVPITRFLRAAHTNTQTDQGRQTGSQMTMCCMLPVALQSNANPGQQLASSS